MTQLPYKGLTQDLFRTPAPTVISVLILLYILGLSYYSHYIKKDDPEFSFYSKSTITLVPLTKSGELMINAVFNNVIEGQRESVPAVASDSGAYIIDIDVNSPRPATIYIEGESVEVFLIPDSSLTIYFSLNPSSQTLDSVKFKGAASEICRFYRLAENRVYTQVSTLSSEDLNQYAKKVDSLTKNEIDFLDKMKDSLSLPEWFVKFEHNELTYFKAYSKMVAVGNKPIPGGLMEGVPLDNEDAIFSYYYYLYLNQYFKWLSKDKVKSENPQIYSLKLSDSLLKSEAHDIYLTRTIVHCMQKNQYETAKLLFDKYSKIKQKKYYRFLERTLEKPNQKAKL